MFCPRGDPWGIPLLLEISYSWAPVKPRRGRTPRSPRPKVKVTSVPSRKTDGTKREHATSAPAELGGVIHNVSRNRARAQIMLCYAIPYYTMVYYTILYYNVLCYIILCYTIISFCRHGSCTSTEVARLVPSGKGRGPSSETPKPSFQEALSILSKKGHAPCSSSQRLLTTLFKQRRRREGESRGI